MLHHDPHYYERVANLITLQTGDFTREIRIHREMLSEILTGSPYVTSN